MKSFRTCGRGARWIPLMGGLCLCATVAAAERGYVAKPLREFASTGDVPLLMPNAVAVDEQGSVFVADGVHDRIVQFDAQGREVGEIRNVGDQSLSRPIGLKCDAAGRLWIADAGHGRVVVRRPDGGLDRVIAPPEGTTEKPVEITDVLPAADGDSCWMMDNENHRLIYVAAKSEDSWVRGSKGEALGNFHFPFMIARGGEGDLLITDVLNARIEVWKTSGAPVAVLGTYGLNVGQLYRPKGIAVDRQETIWVSDSVVGVVQAFMGDGRAVDVLRDEAGEPFRFDTPMGMCFDPQGRLYVVELRPGRVRQLEIVPSSREAKPTPRPGKPAADQRPAAKQPRMCTVCHLEWMEPFASGASSPLMPRPRMTPDEPLVSRSEICLSCHDGGVGDSRRRVWSEHGHQTGQPPPEHMRVPANLPLVKGRLACRTCHSAHGASQPQEEDIGSSIFLRIPNRTGQLCVSCHTDKTGGPATGSHPIGGMPWPVPEALVQAGAHPGPNPRELTCQVCHMPHGSHQERLLVMGVESSQLCLTCHTKLRPGLWLPDTPREHPQNPPLASEAQHTAIAEMGTRIGKGDTLICLSCHKMHHGQPGQYILADTLTESRICLRCHPYRGDMVGTRHDLRTTAPQERNRIGQTPDKSGPCGACHSFHQFARKPDPQPDDPSGLCVTCHQAGQCAEKAGGRPFSHPQSIDQRGPDATAGNLMLFPAERDGKRTRLACLTCHDPHETKHANFLRQEPDQICAQCHADHVDSLAGAHDFSQHPQLANLKGETAAQSGNCSFCHAVHDAQGPVLWAGAATVGEGKGPNDLCIACHRPDGLAKDERSGDLRHPIGSATVGRVPAEHKFTPLLDDNLHESSDGAVVCATCHDVHGNSTQTAKLLRYPKGHPPAALCQDCHRDTVSIEHSLHADKWTQAKLGKPAHGNVSPCAACHTVHAPPGSQAVGMWAGPVGPAQYPEHMRDCLGCHGSGGPATRVPHITVHPAAPMRNAVAADQPGFMPLVDDQGKMGEEGRITCRTCHLQHGRPTDESAPATQPADRNLTEKRALATLLRPYQTPNLCSTCHGSDGLLRYLYYHHPQKRQ